MKTVTILSVLTSAISSVSNQICMLRDCRDGYNTVEFELSPDESLSLSECMSILTDLWDELPEDVKAMASEEEQGLLKGFYKFKYNNENEDGKKLLDVDRLHDHTYLIHTLMHKLLRMARTFSS